VLKISVTHIVSFSGQNYEKWRDYCERSFGTAGTVPCAVVVRYTVHHTQVIRKIHSSVCVCVSVSIYICGWVGGWYVSWTGRQFGPIVFCCVLSPYWFLSRDYHGFGRALFVEQKKRVDETTTGPRSSLFKSLIERLHYQ
jgi:hypothetical protein